MAELSDFLRFIVPFSGDRRWHEAHVEFRERRGDDADVGISYAAESTLYIAKYVLPGLAVISYLNE